jgi:cyclic pyranopterin phosphate synthase
MSSSKKVSLEELSHFDSQGRARMVDVTDKEITAREAEARGEITMAKETIALVKAGKMAKGDVLAVAQVAAVMGVKETSRLIPMCHPLLISGVSTDFVIDEEASKIEAIVRVKITGQTGVEMEALTGANIALLTIYDMCKAVDKNMVMGNVRLMEKSGGRSGHYTRKEQ